MCVCLSAYNLCWNYLGEQLIHLLVESCYPDVLRLLYVVKLFYPSSWIYILRRITMLGLSFMVGACDADYMLR